MPKSQQKLIVAIDIDDTITRHPEFFAFLTRSLVEAGHEVLIVTFRIDRENAELELREWGISYTELLTPSPDPESEEGTDKWKAQLCATRCVDVFFEESPEVLRLLGPTVLGLMPVDMSRYDLNRLFKS
jgi:hypothetical protein